MSRANIIVDKLLESPAGAVRTASELLRYPNHPLAHVGHTCRKCKGANVQAPAYPGDYFDCLDCGFSWAPTAGQTSKMYHRVDFDKQGRAVRRERLS